MIIVPGSTSVSVYFYIVEDVGGTNPGEPKTGLLFSDIETGGSASYMRQGAARVDFALITLASASAAWAAGGFILVDDTNLPGVYRCDVPDAAFVAGVDLAVVGLVIEGTNNAVATPLLVTLRSKQGYNAMLETTVATVNNPTDFDLTAGSGDDNAYVDAIAVFFDADGDPSFRRVLTSTASGNNITIDAAADFTVVATDPVIIYPAAVMATALEIADAVLDEVLADHTIAGSLGAGLQGARTVVSGLAEAGTLSTTQMTTNLGEATDEHYVGRAVLWLTGPLANQASDITAYLGTTGMLTYSTVTDVPVAGNAFVIV